MDFNILKVLDAGDTVTNTKVVGNLIIMVDDKGFIKIIKDSNLNKQILGDNNNDNNDNNISFDFCIDLHDDWITCLEVLPISNQEYMIYSGGYDTLVKLSKLLGNLNYFKLI